MSAASPVNTDLKLASPSAFSAMNLTLRPLMPPDSLTSSTRICMPKRRALPKPASGPERSWMVPITISFLLTPICSAAIAGATL